MSRPVRILLILIILGAVVGGIAMAYIYVSGGSGQPSAPITAPTLDAASVDNTEGGGDASSVVFNIVPEESEVRFTIDELLRGQPNRVVGRTDQVAGQILVNFDNPAASEVGPIRVNVYSLATDQEMRNRAIRTFILQSNQEEFEFSQFTPTSVEGLPDSITIGEPFDFTINGDLQVRHITQPMTFNVQVTPVDETTIVGLATTTVTRAAYELQIPNAPGVADVSEEVGLEIEFTARAGGASGAEATEAAAG